MFVILFFVLFIGQLSMQLVADNIYLDLYFFYPFVSLVNSQVLLIYCGCTHRTKSAALIHFRTRWVCSEIIYISFEKVRDIFLQNFEI